MPHLKIRWLEAKNKLFFSYLSRPTIIKERKGIGAHQSDLMGHLTRSFRVKTHNVPDLAK